MRVMLELNFIVRPFQCGANAPLYVSTNLLIMRVFDGRPSGHPSQRCQIMAKLDRGRWNGAMTCGKP